MSRKQVIGICIATLIFIISAFTIEIKVSDTYEITSGQTFMTSENVQQTHSIIKSTTEIVTQNKTASKTATPKYSNDELFMLSHLIYGEASGCSYEHKLYVGSVVINRVNSELYPDSIKDVVFQKGQYACTWDGNYEKQPDNETIEIAKFLLVNGSQIPENVLYQAEFYQGSGVWKQIDNTYFCYR